MRSCVCILWCCVGLVWSLSTWCKEDKSSSLSEWEPLRLFRTSALCVCLCYNCELSETVSSKSQGLGQSSRAQPNWRLWGPQSCPYLLHSHIYWSSSWLANLPAHMNDLERKDPNERRLVQWCVRWSLEIAIWRHMTLLVALAGQLPMCDPTCRASSHLPLSLGPHLVEFHGLISIVHAVVEQEKQLRKQHEEKAAQAPPYIARAHQSHIHLREAPKFDNRALETRCYCSDSAW